MRLTSLRKKALASVCEIRPASFAAQGFDFVAEDGGDFEIEAGGGFFHLFFQTLDEGGGVFLAFGGVEGGFGEVVVVVCVVRGVEAEGGLVCAGDGVGGDAVGLVVGLLDGAAAVGFLHQTADGVGNDIAEEDAFAVDVAGGAACGLDEAGFVAQEAFLIRIQDADEGDFRQVEPFAQEVDSHEDIYLARAEFAEDFHALDGIHICMDVFDVQPDVAEVVGEVFCGAFGEGGDEDALADGDALVAELDGFVYLPLQREEGDFRLQQSGGADELLYDEGLAESSRVEALHRGGGGVRRHAQLCDVVEEDTAEVIRRGGDGLAGFAAAGVGVAALGFEDGDVGFVARHAVDVLKRPGGGAQVEQLALAVHELVEAQRAVVQRGGQAEAVVDEHLLAGAVALVHAAYLGDGGVRFIDDGEVVEGEIVLKGGGGGARRAPGEVAGVVLDTLAEADFVDEFQVVVRAHLEPLGFDEFVLLFEPLHALFQLCADGGDGGQAFFRRGDVLFHREEEVAVQPLAHAPGHGIDERYGLNLIAEELHADGLAVTLRGVDFHHVAAHAETAAVKVVVMPLKEQLCQAGNHGIAVNLLAHMDGEREVAVVLRCAQTVDAGDAGHHNHIPPQEQGTHGVEAETVNLLVDGAVLFDVGVCAGDVGLRLVVVEVGDEVFHRVVREEALELGIELGCQRFVVGEHQHRPVLRGDDVRHGEGLAAAGHAQQALVTVPRLQRFEEFADGLLLIAGGFVVRYQLKDAHGEVSVAVLFDVLHQRRGGVLQQLHHVVKAGLAAVIRVGHLAVGGIGGKPSAHGDDFCFLLCGAGQVEDVCAVAFILRDDEVELLKICPAELAGAVASPGISGALQRREHA